MVGGAVRDLLLAVDPHDLDFEVYGLSEKDLVEALSVDRYVRSQGVHFGIYQVADIPADWALPRMDTAGRKPEVTTDPYLSYERAFIRRDLTINAMGIEMKSFELIDPFQGLQDLKDRIAKAPDIDFFVQDPLRLLRVMQFVARFELTVDETLSQVCTTMDLSDVSHDRIYAEFYKLFVKGVDPARGLRWLDFVQRFTHFLPQILPEKKEYIFSLLDELKNKKDFACDKFTTMMVVIGQGCSQFLSDDWYDQHTISWQQSEYYALYCALGCSYKDAGLYAACAAVVQWLSAQHDVTPYVWSMIAYHLEKYSSMDDIVWLLSLCDAQYTYAVYRAKMHDLGIAKQSITPLISGHDAMHVKPSKRRSWLHNAYQLQIQEQIRTKEELIKRIRALAE